MNIHNELKRRESMAEVSKATLEWLIEQIDTLAERIDDSMDDLADVRIELRKLLKKKAGGNSAKDKE